MPEQPVAADHAADRPSAAHGNARPAGSRRPPRNLPQRARDFIDGTLANAVEKLAQDAGDPVARSYLYEAADKLRVGAELYAVANTHPEYAADTTFAAIWQWLGRKDRALAKARGEIA